MYEHAFPCSSAKGFRRGVFVVSDWIERAAPSIDRLYLLLTRDWPPARVWSTSAS
jgi:hypothetical protein